MSFVELQKNFNQIDTDNSGALDLNEFTTALLALQLELTEVDIKRMFAIFDQNHDGCIQYNEYVNVLRGRLSATRLKLVERAF